MPHILEKAQHTASHPSQIRYKIPYHHFLCPAGWWQTARWPWGEQRQPTQIKVSRARSLPFLRRSRIRSRIRSPRPPFATALKTPPLRLQHICNQLMWAEGLRKYCESDWFLMLAHYRRLWGACQIPFPERERLKASERKFNMWGGLKEDTWKKGTAHEPKQSWRAIFKICRWLCDNYCFCLVTNAVMKKKTEANWDSLVGFFFFF